MVAMVATVGMVAMVATVATVAMVATVRWNETALPRQVSSSLGSRAHMDVAKQPFLLRFYFVIVRYNRSWWLGGIGARLGPSELNGGTDEEYAESVAGSLERERATMCVGARARVCVCARGGSLASQLSRAVVAPYPVGCGTNRLHAQQLKLCRKSHRASPFATKKMCGMGRYRKAATEALLMLQFIDSKPVRSDERSVVLLLPRVRSLCSPCNLRLSAH
jgi:hypothetical protein